MKKKYYAVRKGRTPGIYETWADCEKEVKGCKGAIFKSFPTKQEAEAFMLGGGASNLSVQDVQAKEQSQSREHPDIDMTADMFAYIDGSYDKMSKTVGYGGIIVREGIENPFSYGTQDAAYAEFWNISGELLAAMHVMKYALKEGLRSCAIYYDCQGIEMWATGAWKTNTPLTKYYASFAKKIQESVELRFYKVAAHTGVYYNEWADKLAKEGVSKIKNQSE